MNKKTTAKRGQPLREPHVGARTVKVQARITPAAAEKLETLVASGMGRSVSDVIAQLINRAKLPK